MLRENLSNAGRRVAAMTLAVGLAAGVVVATAGPASASPASVTDDTAGVRGVVYATMQVGNRIYLGGEFDFAGRWSGSGSVVDTTGGRVATPALRIVGNVDVAIPDGIGGWFIGGDFTQVLGRQRLGLARITAAGKLSAFTANVGGSVNALAYQSGVLYVGGNFNTVAGSTRANLAAITASTSTVTSWNPGADGPVQALRMSGSSVLVGGAFATAGSASRASAAAIDVTTGNATSWNPSVTGEVRAIELASNGSVVLGGDFTQVGVSPREDLAMVDASTGSVGSWNPGTNGAVNGLGVSGTSVFVGGSFSTFNGGEHLNVGAVSDTGDAISWNPSVNGAVADLEAANDGTVLLAGDFDTVNGAERLNGAALDAGDGTLASWDPSTDGSINAVATSGSKRLVGGAFTYVNGAARTNLAALDVATGDLVREFRADTNAVVRALEASDDGSTVYAGGAFTLVNGEPRSRLVAVEAASGALTAWAPVASNTVSALAVDGGWLYAGGSFTNVSTVYANRLARISTVDGKPDKLFKPKPDGNVKALQLTEDGQTLFPIGGYKKIAGVDRPGAAAINATTGVATSFAPTAGGEGIAAELSTDESRIYFSTSSNRTYAYDYAQGNSPTWVLRTGGDVQAIGATATEIYVGGHFTNFPEQHLSRPHLGSVNPVNGVATDWRPGANGSFGVWSITPVADALLIGGDFDKSGGRKQPGFGRFAGTP